jgi:vacuolar-type H+-ATPase subunit F/Vma7
MSVTEFIGDEVTAAGYRLSGVDVHVADDKNVMHLVKQARARASLVLVGSNVLQGLDNQELYQLLASTDPPVLVVPDVRELAEVPDITERIHKQLGMLE